MKYVIAPAFLVLAVAAQAMPAIYDLDPDHSFVHFEVLHFGTATLRGRFGPVHGTVTLDREARSGEIGLRIATAGVDTGVSVLDARLRQPELLDSTGWPEAFFVARNFRFEGAQLAEVRGEFTLRGHGEALSLHAQNFGCRVDAQRMREVCGGDFVASFRRSVFGIDFGLPFVADEVRLVIQVEGTRR
jgi:polyisoprenoid-binding protein YceI